MKRIVHRVGLLFAVGVLSACSRSPAHLVAVSDEDGGDVVVVDTDASKVVARIAVGKRPRGMKLSPDHKLLYVALSGSPKAGPGVDESKLPPADRSADGVGVVDLAERKLLRTYPSGEDPESFDLSPDGKTLYVSNEESAELTVLDLASGTIQAKVAVGREPEGVTVSPDGKVVYVSSERDNEVTVIDRATLLVIAHVPTSARPRSIVFSKDSATAFVTNELGGAVTVVDRVLSSPAGTIRIEPAPGKPATARPMGQVLSPDGKQVFVSCGRDGSVAVLDVASRKLARIIDAVGGRPWGIGVSGDGTRLYTANGQSKDVSVVDAASGQVLKRIEIGGSPWGLVTL
jgi:YVTN family beta-propeller protein